MNALRIAFRQLIKTPGYTAIAVLTLALGIGVNTSMFSTVEALLFRDAPYPEPSQLVVLSSATRSNPKQQNFSEQEVREIRAQATEFSSIASVSSNYVALADGDAPAERLLAVGFSREMMETFRTQPMLGRAFAPEEFSGGGARVALLFERFWRNRFAADPGVIGRTLRLDGEAVTIIGVMPDRFDYRAFWGNVALCRPLLLTHEQEMVRGYRIIQLVGRLRPGVTPAAAAAQLAPLAQGMEKRFPLDYPGLRFRLMSMQEASMGELGRGLSWMLLGLSTFVLLIACANLANLQLARATAAAREFAIRAALGASRARLVFQQLTESVMLSTAGGALGLVVALWINSFLESRIDIDGAPGFPIVLDVRILLITLGVSLLTGVVFGLAPALIASRTGMNETLKTQARGSTGGRGHHRMRQALIVGEVALALILLAGATMMNRGFKRLIDRPLGWDSEKILTSTFSISETRYPTPEKRVDLFRKLEAGMARLPGVEKVALATSLPIFNFTADRPVFVDGPAAAGQAPNPLASHVMVTPDFFATLGIPLLEGRDFPPEMKSDGPSYILVNESLAHKFWPNQSAVGKRLGTHTDQGDTWSEVIGVVRDVENASSINPTSTRFTVYRSLAKEPWAYVNLAVRSENPAALVESVRKAVNEIDPNLPADQLATVRQVVDRVQHNIYLVGTLLAGFAGLGLVLAGVGLYGVTSNLVAQRTPEFGIRLALGARTQQIMADVLRHALVLGGVGLLIGLGGAWWVGLFLASLIPALHHADPGALAGVAALLLLVTLVASWFPALRATRVDPLTALRVD